jgi:hypothetical protein
MRRGPVFGAASCSQATFTSAGCKGAGAKGPHCPAWPLRPRPHQRLPPGFRHGVSLAMSLGTTRSNQTAEAGAAMHVRGYLAWERITAAIIGKTAFPATTVAASSFSCGAGDSTGESSDKRDKKSARPLEGTCGRRGSWLLVGGRRERTGDGNRVGAGLKDTPRTDVRGAEMVLRRAQNIAVKGRQSAQATPALSATCASQAEVAGSTPVVRFDRQKARGAGDGDHGRPGRPLRDGRGPCQSLSAPCRECRRCRGAGPR